VAEGDGHRAEPDGTPGTIRERDVLEDYAQHLLTLAPVTGRRAWRAARPLSVWL